jgi:hypothetical protein
MYDSQRSVDISGSNVAGSARISRHKCCFAGGVVLPKYGLSVVQPELIKALAIASERKMLGEIFTVALEAIGSRGAEELR